MEYIEVLNLLIKLLKAIRKERKGLHNGSNISARVFLNLLNKLRKR